MPLDDLPPGEDIATAKTLFGQDGQGSAINFRITAIENGLVKLDANHPLVDETLIFEIEIQGIRDVSAAGIAQAESLGHQSRVD